MISRNLPEGHRVIFRNPQFSLWIGKTGVLAEAAGDTSRRNVRVHMDDMQGFRRGDGHPAMLDPYDLEAIPHHD